MSDVSAWTAGLALLGTWQTAWAGEENTPGSDDTFALKNLTQVAFIVKDIEASARQFAGLLGLPVPKVIVTDPEEKAHTVYRGQATPARAKLAFFSYGKDLAIELIEPVDGPSTWREFLDAHGEGVHHVAFRIQGMDRVTQQLQEKGFETVQRGDFTGGRYAYVDTTPVLKIMIELLETL